MNLIFVLAALGTGVALSLKPWQVYAKHRDQADAALAEMRDAEKNRADLTRLKARYESPVGREELARRQGYVKPGEVSVE